MLSHSRHFKLISVDEYTRLNKELKLLRDKQNMDLSKDKDNDIQESKDGAGLHPVNNNGINEGSSDKVIAPVKENIHQPDPSATITHSSMIDKRHKSKTVKSKEILSVDMILNEIPVKYRACVQKVLSITNGRLRWSDKGELISSSGRLVKGSNICDLLVNMVAPQKSKSSVKGLNEFTKVLDSLYMPIVLRGDDKISSKSRPVKKKKKKDMTVVHDLSIGKSKDKSSSITPMRSGVKNVSNKKSIISQGIKWAVL